MEINSPYFVALAWSLGLRSRDIAEIGGFSGRFARALLKGERPWPNDIAKALLEIDDDIDVIVDVLTQSARDGETTFFIFKKTATLRKHFPKWPGRGHAKGGFNGPHYAAVVSARDVLNGENIETEVLFFEDAAN